MSDSPSCDALRHAFRGIADGGFAPTSPSVASIYLALSDAVDEMRTAGVPFERVVKRVKVLADEAGIRTSHDSLVTDAVLWAIDHYYRDDDMAVLLPAKRDRRSGNRAAADSSSMTTPKTDRSAPGA